MNTGPETNHVFAAIELAKERDRLHRILAHIAEHGRISTDRLTIQTTMGLTEEQREQKDGGALKALIDEVERDMAKHE